MIWRLAYRGLSRNPRRTAVVLGAVGVGIAGCALTVSINAGMAQQMVRTAIATELGHVQIHAPGFEEDPELAVLLEDGGERASLLLDAQPGALPAVRAWAPRVQGQGLLNSPRASVGVRVVAVEPEAEARVSAYAPSLVQGDWLDARPGRAVLGVDLARRLHVGVGDKVVLAVQDLAGDLTGRAFRVSGVFKTSSLAVNRSSVLVRLDDAQRLFGLGNGISEIVVLADSERGVQNLRDALADSLGESAEVRSWQELQPLLVYLVDLMDQMAWAIYAAVFIAMAFGIANVLLMSVFERTHEIGVMMALGMKPVRVVAAVMAESLVVTAVGLGGGLLVGLFAVWSLRGGIDLSSYAAGLESLGVGARIVPVIRPNDMLAPAVMAVLAATVASAWPAIRAAALRPGEALRHV